MIGHASDIKDQLKALGIAVLVDQSSNETHPLGRAEWIKLYAALLDEEEKAAGIFDAQTAFLESAAQDEPTGKTVAFFYVSSTGRIVARKSGDYVCKMIELAGGEYVFSSLGDPESRTSTVTLDPEYFYAEAKDADILIYNATISEELDSLSQMIEKCELLRDFKAVKNGNVWCTGKSMYQESTALGQMIGSLHDIFRDDAGALSEVPFFYRLA
jgi:iron complex transport system substrate-binding protein